MGLGGLSGPSSLHSRRFGPESRTYTPPCAMPHQVSTDDNNIVIRGRLTNKLTNNNN